MSYRITFPLSTIAAAVLLASCSSGSGNDPDTTTLSLGLSDAPVDGANAVVVNVQGVHLHSPGGEDIIYQYCDNSTADNTSDTDIDPTIDETEAETDTANETTEESGTDVEEDTMQAESEPGCESPVSRAINLLALTGGESVQLLDGISVEPGKYPWVRLTIDESNPGHIELLDGTIHPLSIPSGAQTGLKINKGFTATVGGDNRFMIDFDLRKSVHLSGQGYKLRPTLRMVKLEKDALQPLTGTWAVTDMNRDCASSTSPMAYVYTGTDGVMADDMGGANSNPLATAKFVADEDGATFSYQIDYIEAGDYTVAYACEGDLDDPIMDDNIVFVSTTTVTVGSTEETTEETTEAEPTDTL